jgi:hypothetical protein
MPIKNNDFGKYKRSGIFIEEIDSSIIELPVQNVLVNLVPGFSKKGPFNAPIYCTNPNQFTDIFGDDDRRLENKGSFFHKTVKQMLKNGPVWALNLLATNPNRDKVDWQSISVSSQYQNGDVTRSAYESFFNRQDFWERDSDAFLNVVKANNYGVVDNERLFHITNMGDKDITVFMFKSSISGFDVTAEEWYGDRTKVPAYIDYREWISDYLAEVVVVAGDWSDYKTLSNDTTFSKYFNRNGLMKNQVNNFINERTVTILGKYDVSLIPYFKDINNRDMYIKSIINNNTDKTGLFCTYNEDSLLEADFKLGNLDIIGDVIVGQDISSIKFMSYDATLKETLTYSQKYLDSSNNVITNNLNSYNLPATGTDDRTGIYTNGSTYQIYYGTGTTTTFVAGADMLVEFFGGAVSHFVINGTLTTGFTYTPVTVSGVSASYTSRYDVLYLTSDNKVNILYGAASNTVTAIKPDYTFSLDSTIILGYIYTVNSGGVATLTYYPVTVSSTGYVSLNNIPSYGLTAIDDFDTLGTYVKIEFTGTSGKTGTYNEYGYLRAMQAFTEMYDRVTTQSVMIQYSGTNSVTFMDGIKVPVTSIMPIDATSTSNASIKFYVVNADLCHWHSAFLIYYVDNEFLFNPSNTNTLITRYTYAGDSSSASKGIVATYSQLYQDYYNGIINNLDYFYVNNNSGGTSKIFLKMFLDQSNILTVNFLETVNPDTQYSISYNSWRDDYLFEIDIHSNRSNWEQSVEIEATDPNSDLTNCQQIWVNKNRYSEITKGGFLAAYYDVTYYEAPSGPGYLEGSVPRKLTRIINVKNDPNNVDLKILYTDAPIMISDFNIATGTTAIDYQTFTYPSIDAYVDEYKALKISPFVVHTDSIPNGTDSRQNAILDIINKDTNLAKGLADKNKISWRYLVDSFGLGLVPIDGFGSKQQLADLCGMKLNALGFINMPSAKIFRESTNPSFTNDDGSLNTAFIMAGADDSKNPDFYYQFAQKHGDIDGRSCTGYFFPYIRIYDNGIPKWVPPSSYAATTYMQKFTSNVAGMLPWTICAGITNGRIQNITKTEMDFTNTDLENLHQMNANPIVYKINNGYCINDEMTAQVFPYSSLSFLHSREVLIELENRLYDMLLRYQWSFNTPEIRSEIKYRADKICKDMLDNDAFYDFWNVCDVTNNTDYVIDLQMGVLDTYVEIIKGMGIIVNNSTIMKKGDIQSMGFK